MRLRLRLRLGEALSDDGLGAGSVLIADVLEDELVSCGVSGMVRCVSTHCVVALNQCQYQTAFSCFQHHRHTEREDGGLRLRSRVELIFTLCWGRSDTAANYMTAITVGYMNLSLRRNRSTPKRRRRRRRQDETIQQMWQNLGYIQKPIQEVFRRQCTTMPIQEVFRRRRRAIQIQDILGSVELIQQHDDDDDETGTIATKHHS